MSDISKYQLLINTLDSLINESPVGSKKYYASNEDSINQARARALIHLYLRTTFGIIDFSEAERYITDGSGDGGLDAYFIDKDSTSIYLIQSKFRTKEENFEKKSIDGYELFKMELDKIVNGHLVDSKGNKFNGKVLELQRKIKEIGGVIGKYKYYLVFLGNVPANLEPSKLNKVSGSVCDYVYIINGKETYNILLLPYLQSDFYNKREFILKIKINQNQSNRINYSVKINEQLININLSFIPTLEVAKMMRQYKNSILKYNPRCYIGLKDNKVNVNKQIQNSISNTNSNEFSLLNNGITIICTNFEYTERNAEPNSATILVTNPQIVNGGQTAFTLAKILNGNNIDIFNNKEVLAKFISLDQSQTPEQILLIEKISETTNNQTPVYLSDRKSNDENLVELQKYLFENHGLLLERKKGEFYEAIENKIISKDIIIDKSLLMRLIFVKDGKVSEARGYADEKLFENYQLKNIKQGEFKKIFNVINIYKQIEGLQQKAKKSDLKYRTNEFGSGLKYGKFAIVGAILIINGLKENAYSNLTTIEDNVLAKWKDFETTVSNNEHNADYYDDGFNFFNYYKGKTINKDLKEYFATV